MRTYSFLSSSPRVNSPINFIMSLHQFFCNISVVFLDIIHPQIIVTEAAVVIYTHRSMCWLSPSTEAIYGFTCMFTNRISATLEPRTATVKDGA
jgi:hypothetical protein